MKFSKILPLLPIIGLLTSCAQPEVKVPDAQNMLKEELTQAPTDFVVYPDDRPSIPDGKLVWESAQKGNCASCHGATGAGGTADGKTVAALSDPRKMAQMKPVETYKFITFGKDAHHKMQDKLTNREIWNLVFYSRSLATPPLAQADLDAINPVFGSNCAVCHGTKGDGDGPLARNLEPMPANFQTFRRFYDRTDDTLFDHIANGIKWEGMPNFLGKEDKKKNVKFDHAYIKKLVQYVRTFHVSNEPTMVADASGTSTSTTTSTTTSTEAAAPTGATTTGTDTTAPATQSSPPASSQSGETKVDDTSEAGKSTDGADKDKTQLDMGTTPDAKPGKAAETGKSGNSEAPAESKPQ
ncbi:MAG: cytochrome c [Candidatus Obscuribacterales bacterium]|jgi:mono/diheme cytochrome c family protein|nr:cytochrome c [Candidatus Obscuribacterales bacterium]